MFSLCHALQLLPESKLVECLPLLQEFLDDHNERNWRYRLKLVEQLSVLCEVYCPDLVSQHITPLAIALAEDKVAELRVAASDLVRRKGKGRGGEEWKREGQGGAGAGDEGGQRVVGRDEIGRKAINTQLEIQPFIHVYIHVQTYGQASCSIDPK